MTILKGNATIDADAAVEKQPARPIVPALSDDSPRRVFDDPTTPRADVKKLRSLLGRRFDLSSAEVAGEEPVSIGFVPAQGFPLREDGSIDLPQPVSGDRLASIAITP